MKSRADALLWPEDDSELALTVKANQPRLFVFYLPLISTLRFLNIQVGLIRTKMGRPKVIGHDIYLLTR